MSVHPPVLVLRIKEDKPHKEQMGEVLGPVPGTLGFSPMKPTGSGVRAQGFRSSLPSSQLCYFGQVIQPHPVSVSLGCITQRAEGGLGEIMLEGYGTRWAHRRPSINSGYYDSRISVTVRSIPIPLTEELPGAQKVCYSTSIGY